MNEEQTPTRPKPISNDSGAKIGFYELKPETLLDNKKPGNFIDTFAANVRLDNTLINNAFKIDSEFRTLFEYFDKDYEEGFNPLDKNVLAQADPQDWPSLVTSRTSQEFYRRLARREQERGARETASNGTLAGNLVGGLFNGITDPASWIPIANGLRSANVGTGFISGFKNALPGSFVSAAMSESNLEWAKETQSIQESALNTVVQTLFGGIVGGAVGAYRSATTNVYKDIIESTVQGKEVKFSLDSKGNVDGFNIFDDSAGAASVKKVWLEDNQLYGFTKDGKMSVARPFFWMAGKWAKNPVVQGLSSHSPTVAKFTSDMYEHNFDIVKSAVHGKYKPQAMQTSLRKYENLSYRADLDVANHYFEYLGLPQGQTIRNLSKTFFKDNADKLKFQDYTRELNLAISRGGVSKKYPEVGKAAKDIYAKYYEPLQEELVKLGILAPNYKPFGSVQYLNRIPDREYIVGHKPRVQTFLEGKFAQTNDKVTKATFERSNLEELIAQNKALLAEAADAQKPQYQSNIDDFTKRLAGVNRKIRNKERQAKYSPDMLVGKAGMSFDEQKALKALRKPINQSKRTIKQLEQELSVVKRKPDTEGLAKIALEAKIKDEKIKLQKLRDGIEAKIDSGALSDKFYYTASNGSRYLRKVDYGTLKLRKILNETELSTAAENAIDNMVNLSDFKITQGIMDGLKDGSNGPDPFKQRTLLIPDEDLYKNKILVSDTRKNLKAFIKRTGAIIEMQKYLKNNGYKGERTPVEWLTHNIKQDYKTIEFSATQKFKKQREGITDKAALEKIDIDEQNTLTKIDKDRNRDINLSSTTYNRITGGYDYNPKDAGLIRGSRFLNNWAYATQLGALVFMSLQDAVAPIFRNGTFYIKGGVLPFVGNMLKGDWKANKLLQQQAADLALGVELDRALLDIAFQSSTDFELPLNFIERQAGNAASAMGIANLSNLWSDKWTRIASTASTSRLLRDARAFVDGSISKGAKHQLAIVGLNDVSIAKRIVAMDDKFGQSLSGGRLANWNDWTDREIRDIFQGAVKQEVRSTVFSGKNIANYPTTFENPNGLSSAFLVYMGWMFNATANYTIPLLQRFDPNKVMGITAMIAAGSLVDPLRKISRGEEPELEPFTLFKKGILNSGVGGLFVDTFNKANAVGDIIPSLQVDRYKGKGFELAAGMPGTLVDVGLNFAGQAANNEWNRSDLKKLKRVIPLLEAFYFRKFTNDFIDSLNIPKTRAKARKERE